MTVGIGLLEAAQKAGIVRSDKTEIDYYVANGIKARVALTMHRWEDAVKAADEALKGYAGKETLTAAQLASGMNDVTALPSVMWGEVKTTDNYGMYLSFHSQMDAGHDGYAKNARRCCTAWLLEPHECDRCTPCMVVGEFRQCQICGFGVRLFVIAR